MAGAIIRVRLTEQTKDIAHSAYQTKEVVEFCDRRGNLQRGRVVSGVEYEFGIDAGFFVWLELEGDYTTQDVIAKVMQMREGK